LLYGHVVDVAGDVKAAVVPGNRWPLPLMMAVFWTKSDPFVDGDAVALVDSCASSACLHDPRFTCQTSAIATF